MSSMLEQAIIDAEQLKETAQRTAEEAVIEKYQSEIKEAVNAILEQEDPLAEEEAGLVVDGEGDVSLVDDLPSAQLTEEDDIVEINLDQLEEMMAQEMEEGTMDPADMLEREEVAEEIAALTEEELDEEIELDEDINDLLEEEDDLDEATIEIDDEKLAAAITGQMKEEVELDEEIDIDEAQLAEVIAELLSEEEDELGPDLAPVAAEEAEADELAAEALEEVEVVEETEEIEEKKKKKSFPDLTGDGKVTKADILQGRGVDLKESKLLQKKNKTLLREQKKMNNKVQLLENKVEKYGTVIEQLKEKLDESNLTNAKLLYQNRILNSISLNERQKDKIVEAISNATSVEEAKIIFETLQSAVGIKSKKTRKQESLNEVVTRSSSAFIPRKEVKPNTNAFSERMQRLAGLK